MSSGLKTVKLAAMCYPWGMRPSIAYYVTVIALSSCTGTNISPPPEAPPIRAAVDSPVVSPPNADAGGGLSDNASDREGGLSEIGTGGNWPETGSGGGTSQRTPQPAAPTWEELADQSHERLGLSGSGGAGPGDESDSCPFDGANIPLECSGGERCTIRSNSRDFLCWCADGFWMCRLLDVDAGQSIGSGGAPPAPTWAEQCFVPDSGLPGLRTDGTEPFVCVHLNHDDWHGVVLCPNDSNEIKSHCTSEPVQGCKVVGYECYY
jgi:hypothetical protein